MSVHDTRLERAGTELRRGAFATVVSLCESVLAEQPENFLASMFLGEALRMTGRPREALAACQRAERANPGQAAAFTAAALLGFRMAHGAPPRPRPALPGGRVQCTALGAVAASAINCCSTRSCASMPSGTDWSQSCPIGLVATSTTSTIRCRAPRCRCSASSRWIGLLDPAAPAPL